VLKEAWGASVALDDGGPLKPRTENDFAAVKDAYNLVSWSTVGFDLQKFCAE
jgi:hypothetical protein